MSANNYCLAVSFPQKFHSTADYALASMLAIGWLTDFCTYLNPVLAAVGGLLAIILTAVRLYRDLLTRKSDE